MSCFSGLNISLGVERWAGLGGHAVFQGGSSAAGWCLTPAVLGLPLPGSVVLTDILGSGPTDIPGLLFLLLLFLPGDFSFHTRNIPGTVPHCAGWGVQMPRPHLPMRCVFIFNVAVLQ